MKKTCICKNDFRCERGFRFLGGPFVDGRGYGIIYAFNTPKPKMKRMNW